MKSIQFPRPIISLHQLEITSRCNLRCVYCPSPSIVAGKYPNRPAGDMSRELFLRSLEWVKAFVAAGTQRELNLAGIGESTMHPDFVDFVRLAREAVGPVVKIIFATNGLIHDEAMVRAIAPYSPQVFVSLHRPEKAGRAIEVYRKYGLLAGASADPSISPNSWAGQVDWIDSGQRMRCQWLQDGKAMVMADGRITVCCLDASGAGVIGHVRDEIGTARSKPFNLCTGCYQDIGSDTWDQKRGVPK